MDEVNWKIVRLMCSGPYGLRNSYTAGLEENYGHREFQCILNVPDKLILYTLNSLGVRVSKGEVFKEGQIITDLFENGVNARLDKAIEDGREVLRVILHDPGLRWPEDPQCKTPYHFQTMRVFEDDSDYPCKKGECKSPCSIRH